MVKKKVKKAKPRIKAKQKVSKSKVARAEKKFKIVRRQLIFFVILTLISYALFTVSNEEMYMNLFEFLYVIFGFVSIAFLIIFVAFLFMRLMKK
ncbi:MAG: hypothetical protein ABIB79_02140 [archaeon]